MITLPIDRSKGITRFVMWAVPAIILGAIATLLLGTVELGSSRWSNRLVSICTTLITLPVAGSAVLCAYRSVRWLLLGIWPGRIGIWASETQLTINLGPMGNSSFETSKLNTLYPFELPEEMGGGDFEAFLPQSEQLNNILPKITHPSTRERLDRKILLFATGSESQIATALRPMIKLWRGES